MAVTIDIKRKIASNSREGEWWVDFDATRNGVLYVGDALVTQKGLAVYKLHRNGSGVRVRRQTLYEVEKALETKVQEEGWGCTDKPKKLEV